MIVIIRIIDSVIVAIAIDNVKSRKRQTSEKEVNHGIVSA